MRYVDTDKTRAQVNDGWRVKLMNENKQTGSAMAVDGTGLKQVAAAGRTNHLIDQAAAQSGASFSQVLDAKDAAKRGVAPDNLPHNLGVKIVEEDENKAGMLNQQRVKQQHQGLGDPLEKPSVEVASSNNHQVNYTNKQQLQRVAGQFDQEHRERNSRAPLTEKKER